MDDLAELVAEFESCRLAPSAFNHEAHLKLCWALLRDDPKNTPDRLREGLKRYAAAIGKADRYDEALTMRWFSAVSARMHVDGPREWRAFIAANPDLLDKGLFGA